MPYQSALLKATLDSSLDGILVVDHDTKQVKEYNRQFLQIWNIPPSLAEEHNDEKLLSFVMSQLTHPEKFIQLVQDLYANPEKNSHDFLVFKDGKIFERYSQPLFIDDVIKGRVWFFRDNTQKITNENLLKNILGTIPSLVSYVDKDLKYQYVNKAYERWFDLKMQDCVGKSLQEVLGDEAFSVIRPYVDIVLSGKDIEYEALVPYKHTSKRSVNVHYIPDINTDNEVRGYFSIVRDVTQEKKDAQDLARQQAQLINASKLSSLGEMAGSIAHEINNPLSIIRLSTMGINKLIDKNKLDTTNLKEMTSDIDLTIDRIEKIIKGLRNISRSSEGTELNETNLNSIFEDVLSLATEKLRKNSIELRKKYTPADLEVSFITNRIQLTQVLINLLNNSFDAVLSCSSSRWIELAVMFDSHEVTLMVKDSGNGIPLSIKEKIFHPFFTTKEIGKGTGIGLSISKSIIENLGGKLFLDESSGNTCFVIQLPRDQKKVDPN